VGWLARVLSSEVRDLDARREQLAAKLPPLPLPARRAFDIKNREDLTLAR
jgi:hypothetical protein